MPIDEMLTRLEPLERRVVDLVYVEGRSAAEAARLLAVDRTVVVTTLAAAFRRVARWVTADSEAHRPRRLRSGATAAAAAAATP